MPPRQASAWLEILTEAATGEPDTGHGLHVPGHRRVRRYLRPWAIFNASYAAPHDRVTPPE
jgi:hypothetical protein